MQITENVFPGRIDQPNFRAEPGQDVFLICDDGVGRVGRVSVVEVVVWRAHDEAEEVQLSRKLLLGTDHVGRGVEALVRIWALGGRQQPEQLKKIVCTCF